MWQLIRSWASGPHKNQEINHRTIKMSVGFIAIALCILTKIFSPEITSISASFYVYHDTGKGQTTTVFIGFLFAISALMMAYNGQNHIEGMLCRVAAFAALGVALFPCACVDECRRLGLHGPDHSDACHAVCHFNFHAVSANVMFIILAYFCALFWRRALHHSRAHPLKEGRSRAKTRAWCYALCGFGILTSIFMLSLDNYLNGKSAQHLLSRPDYVYWFEALGLASFGFLWLLASHVLPFFVLEADRYRPWRGPNPNSNVGSAAQGNGGPN